jgi:hypothetical protein
MPERTLAVGCIVLLTALIAVIWAAYGITDAVTHTTYKCEDELNAILNPNQDLPGGGKDPKFSTSPWSIGQRDCFWFACDPHRCALPALFSEASDLCIDQAYFKDKNGDDCISWTRHVTGTDAMWSPRKDGTDPKCNSPMPNKPLTDTELLDMKRACCVCGGGLNDRDYAGPIVAPDKKFQPPPAVTVPEQHKGKTPTHITQCPACWIEAENRAIVGKSAAEIKDIEENKKIYGNPRGGTLFCASGEVVDFDKHRDRMTPFVIGASVITALLLCLCACICQLGNVKRRDLSDGTDATPFLVRL